MIRLAKSFEYAGFLFSKKYTNLLACLGPIPGNSLKSSISRSVLFILNILADYSSLVIGRAYAKDQSQGES